jgi:hypothetical protein
MWSQRHAPGEGVPVVARDAVELRLLQSISWLLCVGVVIGLSGALQGDLIVRERSALWGLGLRRGPCDRLV